MRKIREVLRLKFAVGLSARQVAVSLQVGRASVGEYLNRFAASGLTWPPVLTDAELQRRLFPPQPAVPSDQRPMPDWTHVHAEFRRPGVTLALLWQEYRLSHPQASNTAGSASTTASGLPRSMWSCVRNTVLAKSCSSITPARPCQSLIGEPARSAKRRYSSPCWARPPSAQSRASALAQSCSRSEVRSAGSAWDPRGSRACIDGKTRPYLRQDVAYLAYRPQ